MADSKSTPKLISCKEAKRRGLRFYFTGRPCPRGHVAPRYVTAFACRDCLLSEESLRKSKVRCRAWYVKNREYVKAKSTKWYLENRERAAQNSAIRSKLWWKQNPHKRRLYNHKRRAQEHGNGGTYKVADILAIYKRQRGKCRYCGASLDWIFHVDHIKPISKGGRNDARNLQILCKPCNLNKSDRDPVKHLERIKRAKHARGVRKNRHPRR